MEKKYPIGIEPNTSKHQAIIVKVCQAHGVKSLELTTKHIALMSDCISEYIAQQAATSVFVPCHEDDPRLCGCYTSLDGQSLAYVRESSMPVVEQGAVWVKASTRLPASWHLKCVRFIHTKLPLLDTEAFLEHNPKNVDLIEWLDESGQSQPEMAE